MNRITFLTFTFILGMLGIVSGLGQPTLALEYQPTYPYPGAPVLLKDLPQGVQRIHFLGRDFAVFDLAGHRIALLAVPLSSKPGLYPITLEGVRLPTLKLRVYPKKYPEEHLTVPERMVCYSPRVLARIKREIKLIKTTVSGFTPEVYLDGPFVWPLKGRLSSPFGLRRLFNGEPRSPHSGIDLAAPVGTPVKAANRGRVVLVGDFYLPGKTLIIDHGVGIYTIYAHLSRFRVKKGQIVARGQVIALSGCTGRATGPHLHFGCYVRGIKIDPQALLRLLGAR